MKKLILIFALFFVFAGVASAIPPFPPSSGGTISGEVNVSDAAYDATGWNGVNTDAPSKNAVRDKIEMLQPLDADLTSIAGGVTGLVKGAGNGSGFSAASAGADYVVPSGSITGSAGSITFAGTISASGDATNFPAATAGQRYRVTSSGWLGGAAGVGVYTVEGDIWDCIITTDAGTLAQVGSSWTQEPHAISLPDGYRKVTLSSNTAASPTAATNELYFESNIFKVNQNGTEYSTAIGPTAGQVIFSGPTAPITITTPNENFTAARTDAANTFTGHQTIEGVTSTGATGTGKFVFDTAPSISDPTFTGVTKSDGNSYATYASTTTSTGNINIDGASYSDYNVTYETDGTGQTYTPVITSAPASGYIRYITLVFGSASTTATLTLTWTNVDAIGTALGTSVTAGKKSQYACKIPSSGHARCAIVAENY